MVHRYRDAVVTRTDIGKLRTKLYVAAIAFQRVAQDIFGTVLCQTQQSHVRIVQHVQPQSRGFLGALINNHIIGNHRLASQGFGRA